MTGKTLMAGVLAICAMLGIVGMTSPKASDLPPSTEIASN